MKKYLNIARSCGSATTTEWHDTLYDYMIDRPRDALYSIAFYLAFAASIPRTDEEFVACAELFNLLDEHLRDTDTLTLDEIRQSRCVNRDDIVQARERFDESSVRVRNNLERWFAPRDDGYAMEKTNLTIDEARDVERVVARVNDVLPLNVDPVDKRVSSPRLDASELRADRIVYPRQVLKDMTTRDTTMSTIGIYAMYAYTCDSYEALDDIVENIRRLRGITISPVYLPRYTAWQRGPAQLLWILLHSICALSVERDNLYIGRLLVLLEHLKYFIWCPQCADHWETNGGSAFHSYLRKLPRSIQERIDIDVSLARCHNFITSTIGRNEALSELRLARILREYRIFVRDAALKRSTINTDKRIDAESTIDTRDEVGIGERAIYDLRRRFYRDLRHLNRVIVPSVALGI